MNRRTDRPASVVKSFVILFGSFILCYLACNAMGAALMFLLPTYAGLIALMALSSVGIWAAAGLIGRRYVVGHKIAHSRGYVTPYIIVLSAFTALLSQPFVEWANYMDLIIGEKLGITSWTLSQTSNQIMAQCALFDNVWHWFLSILVLAALPAISEELFFRGALLPLIKRATGNWTAAVIISAVVFSAIHLDASAFLARTVLGIILGVLFVQTQNIWVSTAFHFTNNLLVVIMLSQSDDVVSTLSRTPELPDTYFTIISIVFTIIELSFIQRYTTMRKTFLETGKKNGFF